ncbi:Sin3 associated polypeptide p18-domain-containing protein [Aspergillus californicus]
MANPKIDRQTTTPFHLKLFYGQNNYHNLSDFSSHGSPSSAYNGPVSGSNAIRSRSPPAHRPAALPAHLQIYTWQSCSLRELSQLLTSALPSMLPDPPIGTRLCFRLIYPDIKSAAMMGPHADARGRYLSKELGSVIIGPRDSPYRDNDRGEEGAGAARTGPFRVQGSDAEKTLQEARFVVGDYVDCAILPPLEDGSVAPPLAGGRVPNVGGGMRAFRDVGFGGGPGGFGGRPGRGRGGHVIPSGDWRRGERVPEGGRGSGGGPGAGPGAGAGRRGWAPY